MADADGRAPDHVRDWQRLVARAVALGVCGGDWERVLDLTPDRLFAVIRARSSINAETQRAILHAVHAAMAPLSQGVEGGGRIYAALDKQLSQASEF